MRTYDPADCIRYVHLAQHPAAPSPAPAPCHRLPAGYPNESLRARLGAPRTAGTRPALVLLPGGPAEAAAGATAPATAPADAPSPAGPALRLAR
jgi:hypothetical protein